MIEIVIAWSSFILVVTFLFLCVVDVTAWFQRVGSPNNSPKNSPDTIINQMYAENVNVNRDPTIPVGEFNPKNIDGKARRKG